MIESCVVLFEFPPLAMPGIFSPVSRLSEGRLNCVFPPLSSEGMVGLLMLLLAHCSIIRGSQLPKSNTVVSTLQYDPSVKISQVVGRGSVMLLSNSE